MSALLTRATPSSFQGKKGQVVPRRCRVSFLSPCGFACLGALKTKPLPVPFRGTDNQEMCGAGTPPAGSGHRWCACLGTVSPHGTGTEGGHVSQLVPLPLSGCKWRQQVLMSSLWALCGLMVTVLSYLK